MGVALSAFGYMFGYAFLGAACLGAIGPCTGWRVRLGSGNGKWRKNHVCPPHLEVGGGAGRWWLICSANLLEVVNSSLLVLK